MIHLKNKETIIKERLGSKLNESVIKRGDVYIVKPQIEIPKSMINAFVSKAKKEFNVDAREQWSDMDLAEMFVTYIAQNFVNADMLPVEAILGEQTSKGEVSTEVEPGEATVAAPDANATEPIAQTTPAPDETGISGEVAFENKVVENLENAGGTPMSREEAEAGANEIASEIDSALAELGVSTQDVEQAMSGTESEPNTAQPMANENKVNEGFDMTQFLLDHGLHNGTYNAPFWGSVVGIILGAIVVAVIGGGFVYHNVTVKKALTSYIKAKYKAEIEGLDKSTVKQFIVNKVKELKADTTTLKDIERRPEAYIQKYANA